MRRWTRKMGCGHSAASPESEAEESRNLKDRVGLGSAVSARCSRSRPKGHRIGESSTTVFRTGESSETSGSGKIDAKWHEVTEGPEDGRILGRLIRLDGSVRVFRAVESPDGIKSKTKRPAKFRFLISSL